MTGLHFAAVAALFLCAGLSLFLLLAMKREETTHLKTRIDRAVGVRAVAAPAEPATRRKTSSKRPSARLRLLFTYRLRRSWGASASTATLLALGLASAAVSVLGGFFFFHLPFLVLLPVALGVFFFLPRILIARQQMRAEETFGDLFPDTVDMIVRMLRAGLPVAFAMSAVGQEAPPPVGAAFRAIAEETQIGIPLEEALQAAGERVGLPDFRFFVVALGLQRSTGGNLAETLEMLSEIIRKRRAIRLKARASTAEVRISALVLGGIPIFILLALIFVSPGYLAPFVTNPTGHVLAGVAILGLAMGGISMRWMIRRALLD